MKHMRKLLAVLLCAAMLAVPMAILASAEGEAAASYKPVIRIPWRVPPFPLLGRTISLQACVALPEMPEGMEGALSYAWYFGYDTDADPISTEAKLELALTKELLEELDARQTLAYSYNPYSLYHEITVTLVVTNSYTDAEGAAKAESVTQSEQLGIYEQWGVRSLVFDLPAYVFTRIGDGFRAIYYWFVDLINKI